ncbi:MAG: arsenosugar biosynthesis radical SAM protein ArsS [Planctomycetaceae bacterium]
MTLLTLIRQGHPLANPERQRAFLEGPESQHLPEFHQQLMRSGIPTLDRQTLTTLQINVGKLCNQTCRHCHVDAGPDRREQMSRQTFDECLRVVTESRVSTVDLTGGAPEMNPHFEWFVSQLRERNCHVIDRCNLTILTAPGFTHLPEFLADHQVEIAASLPCYLEQNCDAQRGDGVFRKSIAALRILNDLGYGQTDSSLQLSLVYNPTGRSLPPDQQQLEEAYRRHLSSEYGITFNRLYTITNIPISRFLEDLVREGHYEEYMTLLVSAFNPEATNGLMCRTTLSVDWDGYLYDCDFNQMLNLPLAGQARRHIRQLNSHDLLHQPVATGRHCFACTAGAGSSCRGALIKAIED